MEVEKVYSCNRCLLDGIYCKVWIRHRILFLCKACYDDQMRADELELTECPILDAKVTDMESLIRDVKL